MTSSCRSSLCTGACVSYIGAEDYIPMLDELIRSVGAAAGLTPEQAALAVAAVLRFFTARLPSAWVGELHERLGTRLRDDAFPRNGAAASSQDVKESSP